MLSEPRHDAALFFPLPSDSNVSWHGAGDLAGGAEVRLQHQRLDAWTSLVAVTEDARRFEEEILRAVAVLNTFEEREIEPEEPEVLDLQPLSRRTVTARITRRGPAKFYLVESDPELDDVD